MENKKLEIKKVEIKMKNGSVISQPNQTSENTVHSSRCPLNECQPYHLKPLRFEKEYIFTYWYHKDTKESIDMNKIEFVEVAFPNNTRGCYTLHYEAESINDMGLSTTLYDYYIKEEFQGIPAKLYLTDIIKNGGVVIAMDLTPPKYSTEIIEGDVFIGQQTLNFLHHDNPQVDNDEVDDMLNRVTYNKEVNTNFDFIYQDAVVCDGTMMFIWNVQTKMFGNLLAGRIVLADDTDKDNSNITYQIGDVTIEIENNVETDKPFPMSKYTIKIPTKVIKL